MKYRKIILILLGSLLFIVLWFFTVGCISRTKPISQSTPDTTTATYKYDWIIIENSRLRNDEEFKAYVEKQVKDTGYIEIKYDKVVRLHKTYLIRAWVFYKKVKKIQEKR